MEFQCDFCKDEVYIGNYYEVSIYEFVTKITCNEVLVSKKVCDECVSQINNTIKKLTKERI